MPVVAAAAIPAVAELLAATAEDRRPESDTALAQLRTDVTDVLERLPSFETAVVLAGGPEPLLHHAAAAEARPQGGATKHAATTVDTELLAAIGRRGQAPRVQSRFLADALGILTLLLGEIHPGRPIVPMTVASRAAPPILSAVAVGLASAATTVHRDVVVLAAGDLALHGPRESVASGASAGDDPAGRWDEQAIEAVASSDVPAMRPLGPLAAGGIGAQGWAPLSVLLELAAVTDLRVVHSTYQVAAGAGRLVALAEPRR